MSDKQRPTVFVGSSHEGLEIARAIQFQLRDVALVSVWNEGVFGLSGGTLEGLVRALGRFDFAVLVVTPDDLISSRDVSSHGPRDNVMFELGLFMGHLGRDRTFALCSDSSALKLPSDLAGVTMPRFRAEDAAGDLAAAVGAALFEIRRAVGVLGRLDSTIRHQRQTQEAGAPATLELLLSFLREQKAIELRYMYGGRGSGAEEGVWSTTWRHVFEATAPYMLIPAQVWSLEKQVRSEIMTELRDAGRNPGEDFNFALAEKTRNGVKVRFVGLSAIKVSQTEHGHETWELTDIGRAALVTLDQERAG